MVLGRIVVLHVYITGQSGWLGVEHRERERPTAKAALHELSSCAPACDRHVEDHEHPLNMFVGVRARGIAVRTVKLTSRGCAHDASSSDQDQG